MMDRSARRLARRLALLATLACLALAPLGQDALACTSIMVGKKASTDGSVMTSHTCDSHRTGSDDRRRPGAEAQARVPSCC